MSTRVQYMMNKSDGACAQTKTTSAIREAPAAHHGPTAEEEARVERDVRRALRALSPSELAVWRGGGPIVVIDGREAQEVQQAHEVQQALEV